MADPIYDASDIVDKVLVAAQDLPYYDGVPSGTYFPKKLGTFPRGAVVGTVYSFIDADPTKNRPQLWWMFYPGQSGSYYYMPHASGFFDMNALSQQGVETVEQKNAQDQTWYEKLLGQALAKLIPAAVVTIIAAAAVRGYFSSRK